MPSCVFEGFETHDYIDGRIGNRQLGSVSRSEGDVRSSVHATGMVDAGSINIYADNAACHLADRGAPVPFPAGDIQNVFADTKAQRKKIAMIVFRLKIADFSRNVPFSGNGDLLWGLREIEGAGSQRHF